MVLLQLKGRGIVEGVAMGEILISKNTLSFLGGIDKNTGIVIDPKSDLYKKKISEKILYITESVGSTVGAYIIYTIGRKGVGPRAIICYKADSMLVAGCAISNIPLIDGIRYEKIPIFSKYCAVNGKEGRLLLADNLNELVQTESLDIKS
ncbi:MAG: DUF126 domain-containing protein [Nitrososphaeria archaeon]